MKTLHALIVALCFIGIQEVSAQLIDTVSYDIRFALDGVDCENRTVCILTQLRSADGQAWNLAGQNYRLFYDGSKADYITNSGESMLPVTQYSAFPDPERMQDVQAQDASNFGFDLPFAETLSFLNYSIDLMNLTSGGVNLPASGEWITTSKLCFEVTQDVIDEPSTCLNLVWARTGLTDTYATAFVEVSHWVEANVTTEAEPNEYDDLDATDGSGACLSSFCNGGDPETTTAACSDGVDNDGDGLIDCADPNCANISPCIADEKTYNLALNLADNGVNCVTGQVCYDINLTATGSSFNLGSQNYRLFYNSGDGAFLSAQSLLGPQFQALSLQNGTPRENVDATGTGTLSYESNLGYIDFALQLGDAGVGSNVVITSTQPTRIAQVCFTMSANVINKGDECFEATWARAGLTQVYETEVVEVDEWVAANNTGPTLAANYGDLSAASGDDACFNLACSDTERGETECSDGIDNDNDGLIDCQDPGCSSTVVCGSSCNAAAPTLGSN